VRCSGCPFFGTACALENLNNQFLGENGTAPYVFVNFDAQSSADMFSTIVFTNLPGPSEFESDNHTFSTTLQAPSSVPEPSTLALAGIAALAGTAVAAAGRRRT
jgi:hypothetical protein